MIVTEFWATCDSCGFQEVVVDNVPGTSRMPKTKTEAWATAKKAGWKGTPNKSKCPGCCEYNEEN
jgi:hypothetical protein